MSEARQAVAAKGSTGQFSPEAQEAIRTRALTGNWEVRRLVKVLGELAQFDEVNEKMTSHAKGWAIGLFVATFLGIFGAAVAQEFLGSALVWLLPPTLLGLAIWKLTRYLKLKKQDLINDFRTCLRPVLRDLAQDLDPSQKLRVRMDLAGPVDRKKTNECPAPPGNYIKGKQHTFEDSWCEVRLPLVDGTTAVIEFDTKWIRLDVSKRGRRGKTKSKTKWRKECVARATLMPPASVRWDEASLHARMDPRLEKVKLVDKDGVMCARMERFWRFKGIGDAPAEAPPGREVVGLLLRLHGAMMPSPEVSA